MGPMLLGAALLIGACALGWWKGGDAERSGAVLILVVWVATTAASMCLKRLHLFDAGQVVVYCILISDLVLATGFLILAIRYSSLWLGAGMVIQGIEFMLNALYMGDPDASRSAYLLRVNLVGYTLITILLSATLLAWRNRAAARHRGTRALTASPGVQPAR